MEDCLVMDGAVVWVEADWMFCEKAVFCCKCGGKGWDMASWPSLKCWKLILFSSKNQRKIGPLQGAIQT